MKLSDIGEFGLIKKLAGGAVNDPSTVVQGIGDDTAVLCWGDRRNLLITSDMLVDGVHFVRGKITPRQLGHKSIAVSLSDIAAMGGKPRHAMISIAITPEMPVEEIEEIYLGIKSILSLWSVNLVGGDTVKSPVLAIDVTVLGEAGPGGAILRSGARPGDVVMVTGTPGASAAGLELLLNPGGWVNKLSAAEQEVLLSAHLTPEPALEQAAALSNLGCVTAMIDVSDGIAGEINHICDRSLVGAEIFSEKIPMNSAAIRAGALCGKVPLDWALYGGEDYSLLFTVPPEEVQRVYNTFTENHLGPVTAIGLIVENKCGVKLILPSGTKQNLSPSGYNHFRVG